MLVSHRHRFIAMRSRASAAPALERVLVPWCLAGDGIAVLRGQDDAPEGWLPHMPAAAVRARLGSATWQGYLKFCLVQHPLEREVAWFWHQLPATVRQDLAAQRFDLVREAFHRYLGSGATMPDDAACYSLAGRFALDAVLRQERLPADLGALCARLGIAPVPEWPEQRREARRLRPEPWPEYYDGLTRAATLARHGAACRLFGYR